MNRQIVNQSLLVNSTVAILPIQAIATGKVLVVAPHPDDETLGCGGAIAVLRSLGCQVHILVISDGTQSHPRSLKYPAPALRALREAETLEATAILGVDRSEVAFVGLPDGAIPTIDPAFTDAVAQCQRHLAAFTPSTIFLPWRYDPHPDHRATWQLIYQALEVVFASSRLPFTASSSPTTCNPYSLLLGVAVVGNLAALILTNSRNAWAIAVGAGIAFAIYQGWRWLVAGVSAIAISIVTAAFGPAPIQQWLRQIVPSYFWQRLTDQLYPNRPEETLRITQWQFAWELTQQRPWTGWGLRNFSSLYQSKMHVWLGHPHNLFLMLTAEIGIPATLVFCGCVAWVLYRGIQTLLYSNVLITRKERLVFFSYLVAFFACIVFNTVDVTIFDFRLNTLTWLLLAAICGMIYSHSNIKFK